MVDLAVPRDIDPAVADLEDVYLFSIDDLQQLIEENRQQREVAAGGRRLLIEEEVARFLAERARTTRDPPSARCASRPTRSAPQTVEQARRMLAAGKSADEVIDFSPIPSPTGCCTPRPRRCARPRNRPTTVLWPRPWHPAAARKNATGVEAERPRNSSCSACSCRRIRRTTATSFSRSAPAPAATRRRMFAGDLFRMYARYAESKGWEVEVLSESPGEHGGYKEIISRIIGRGATRS
jgi:hypothetical protein